LRTKGLVDAAGFDERAEDANQERQVSAGVHVEPVIGQLGAEQRAGRNRRHPIPPEPRFAVRVHHGDLRAVLLRVMQDFVVTGWLLATFDPKNTIRSASSQST